MILFLILLMALALVLQKLASERGLDTVTGTHWPDKRVVEPDEVFSIHVSVRNKSRWVIPFLRIHERLDKSFVPQEGKYRVTTDHMGVQSVDLTTWLKPKQKMTCAIPVSVGSRGRYVLGDFQIFGGDFLGLDQRSKTFDCFNEVVVAPREATAPKLPELFGSFMGERSVNRFIMDDPVLTLGFREYTGREPMKMISWKQSARGSGLMVKNNDYTMEPSVSVLLNVQTDAPDREALLERCFSLTRSVCRLLEQRGVKYTFTTNAMLAGNVTAGAVVEGLGQRHFTGLLEQLGRATYAHSDTLEQMMEKEALRPIAAGRILITPDSEAAPSRALNRLREASGGHLLILRASEVTQ